MWISPFELLLVIIRMCEFSAGSCVFVIDDLLGTRFRV